MHMRLKNDGKKPIKKNRVHTVKLLKFSELCMGKNCFTINVIEMKFRNLLMWSKQITEIENLIFEGLQFQKFHHRWTKKEHDPNQWKLKLHDIYHI